MPSGELMPPAQFWPQLTESGVIFHQGSPRGISMSRDASDFIGW
jgi:hypothetical protein